MIVIQLLMMNRNILTARWIPATVGWFSFVTWCRELETIRVTKPEFVFVCFYIAEDLKQTVILSSSRVEKGFDTLLIFDKWFAARLKYTWLGRKRRNLERIVGGHLKSSLSSYFIHRKIKIDNNFSFSSQSACHMTLVFAFWFIFWSGF